MLTLPEQELHVERRHTRYDLVAKARWDFFSSGSGPKNGYIANISKGGCLLKASELIEHRRWLRLMVETEENVYVTLVGRVTRCENVIEAFGRTDVTLYRYGIEFTYPGSLLTQEPDLIFALSSKNLTVRSCRSRNSRSSLRP